ncbi:MAG: hypothetical protein FWD06_00520 [Oscillospiraceae bacterium]|nr:hypothetical protein [Oscillospiraceae bacterium]
MACLLQVKTIITLMIIVVFCYKTLANVDITSEFVMIASSIITYYFAKDYMSNDTERL